MYTFNEINLLLRGFDAYQKERAALPQPHVTNEATAKLHLFEIYRFVRPELIAFSAFQLVPVSFRAVITAFVAAADLFFNLNPPPAAPAAVEAAASSDTTTTDPTSTDPSFKAGKDL
jgi:hypothetical protein